MEKRISRIVFGSVMFLGVLVRPLSLQASEEIAIWKGEAPGTQGRVNNEEVSTRPGGGVARCSRIDEIDSAPVKGMVSEV